MRMVKTMPPVFGSRRGVWRSTRMKLLEAVNSAVSARAPRSGGQYNSAEDRSTSSCVRPAGRLEIIENAVDHHRVADAALEARHAHAPSIGRPAFSGSDQADGNAT